MSNTNNTGGIGFCGLLTIVFITLKLTEVINWSWWWVLAPIWGPFALALLIILGYIGLKLWGVWYFSKHGRFKKQGVKYYK